MPLISKQTAIQIQLLAMYTFLESKVKQMQLELKAHPQLVYAGDHYELACRKSDLNYQQKMLEVETFCIFYDVMTEYISVEGTFIHLEEITITLTSLLKEFEEQEAYEVCSIIKKWYDEICA